METEKQDMEEDTIINVEKTLAIIKPDAISKANEIIEVIKCNGFSILQVNTVQHKKNLTDAHYI